MCLSLLSKSVALIMGNRELLQNVGSLEKIPADQQKQIAFTQIEQIIYSLAIIAIARNDERLADDIKSLINTHIEFKLQLPTKGIEERIYRMCELLEKSPNNYLKFVIFYEVFSELWDQTCHSEGLNHISKHGLNYLEGATNDFKEKHAWTLRKMKNNLRASGASLYFRQVSKSSKADSKTVSPAEQIVIKKVEDAFNEVIDTELGLFQDVKGLLVLKDYSYIKQVLEETIRKNPLH